MFHQFWRAKADDCRQKNELLIERRIRPNDLRPMSILLRGNSSPRPPRLGGDSWLEARKKNRRILAAGSYSYLTSIFFRWSRRALCSAAIIAGITVCARCWSSPQCLSGDSEEVSHSPACRGFSLSSPTSGSLRIGCPETRSCVKHDKVASPGQSAKKGRVERSSSDDRGGPSGPPRPSPIVRRLQGISPQACLSDNPKKKFAEFSIGRINTNSSTDDAPEL